MAVLKLNDRVLDILTSARSVVSQLDLDKALALVLKKAMDVTNTTAGSIALYSPATATMRIAASKGFSRQFLSSREWTVRRGGLTDRILKTRCVTVINDTTNASFFSDSLAAREGVKSLVCVPLIFSQDIVGILYVDDFTQRTFSPSIVQSLEILASFASVAIHNARTHTAMKHQANTDSLTGLFNRRCFESIIGRELMRAERHGREFSLALVDVDDFKKFNDAHGHQAGDAALAALGESIRSAIRSTDLASRYGGDEMAIILPETNLAKAYNLFANRIRYGIEEGFSRLTGGRYSLSVTIGIASYPLDGINARDLVLAADRALLATKKKKHTRKIGCSRRIPESLIVAP